MGRVLWGVLAMAIAIPIGLLLLYLQVRFLHVVYPKVLVLLVVAIGAGIMWFVDNAGWMPDASQASPSISLRDTNVQPRERNVKKT